MLYIILTVSYIAFAALLAIDYFIIKRLRNDLDTTNEKVNIILLTLAGRGDTSISLNDDS